MIQVTAKLFAVAAVLAMCLPVQPSSAGNVSYMSATGGGACTAASPCDTFVSALASLLPGGGRVLCLEPVADTFSFTLGGEGNAEIDVDCPAGSWAGNIAGAPIFTFAQPNLTLTFRNMSFNGVGGATSAIKVGQGGSGTLIFENCVFENFSGTVFDVEPSGAFNLVIKNSRISNSAAGVLIQPATGGSVTATFDGVTIVENNGGGLKTDTINGPINLAISNSTISKNGGNGMNAVGNGGGAALQNMLTLKNDVIASNGSAGVQANGGNAAVLVNNTVLDTNAAGATSTVNDGRVLTYGNNSIVGPVGSGFNGTASLQ
jgi:hypothetical protein